MKLIKFNPDNKPFYSTEFIKGFEIGARRQFEADSAERKGKWILHQDSRTWECSECHKYQVIHSDYCMHCGARMVNEDDS